MQIVIDISDEEYEDVKKANGCYYDFGKAIVNGIVLPKGHGALIDRGQALDECYNIIVDGECFDVVQYETLLGVPTIIEAESEE